MFSSTQQQRSKLNKRASSVLRRWSYRPRLEPLEDRLAPATFNALDEDMLIADINTANSNGMANAINLTAPNGLYVLNGPVTLSDGPTGLPQITSSFPLTINGNEATIQSNGLTAFRLFDVASGAALSLNNVTVKAFSVNSQRKGRGNHGQTSRSVGDVIDCVEHIHAVGSCQIDGVGLVVGIGRVDVGN